MQCRYALHELSFCLQKQFVILVKSIYFLQSLQFLEFLCNHAPQLTLDLKLRFGEKGFNKESVKNKMIFVSFWAIKIHAVAARVGTNLFQTAHQVIYVANNLYVFSALTSTQESCAGGKVRESSHRLPSFAVFSINAHCNLENYSLSSLLLALPS